MMALLLSFIKSIQSKTLREIGNYSKLRIKVALQDGDLKEEEFAQDKHIPDILKFSPGTDLHEHPLYKSGNILLQDKVEGFA